MMAGTYFVWKKGTRVMWSELGREQFGDTRGTAKKGTVVGGCRAYPFNLVKVRWDGMRYPQNLHKDFLVAVMR